MEETLAICVVTIPAILKNMSGDINRFIQRNDQAYIDWLYEYGFNGLLK